MKLYLSSYRIPTPDDLLELIGKPFNETKVALIPNAKDYYAEPARGVKTREAVDYFQKLGFQVTIVDLRDFSDSRALKKALDGNDLIWANGGNTFILRYEMQRSGFDEAIKELLQAGKVYGGESAGALVAGNDLHGIESADNPDFSVKVIWEGLKLTDRFVLPHVGNADYGEAMEKAKAQHKNDQTMIKLTDSQAYIVNGSIEKVVGAALGPSLRKI